MLVGHKLEPEGPYEVSEEEGQSTADRCGLGYFEVCAKTGENVEVMFDEIIELTYKNKFGNKASDIPEALDASTSFKLSAPAQDLRVKKGKCWN